MKSGVIKRDFFIYLYSKNTCNARAPLQFMIGSGKRNSSPCACYG